MAYVYILKTGSGKYYVGSTTNLKKRAAHHARGFTPSTKKLGSNELIFSQEYPTLAQAREVEKRIKSWKRRDYIERIIREGKIRDR